MGWRVLLPGLRTQLFPGDRNPPSLPLCAYVLNKQLSLAMDGRHTVYGSLVDLAWNVESAFKKRYKDFLDSLHVQLEGMLLWRRGTQEVPLPARLLAPVAPLERGRLLRLEPDRRPGL